MTEPPQTVPPDDNFPGGPNGYDPERARAIVQSVIDDYLKGGIAFVELFYRLKDAVALLTPQEDA